MLSKWIFCTLLMVDLNLAFNVDSIKQWNESQLVCGYPVKILKQDQWEEILEDQIRIETNNKTIVVDKNHKQGQKVIVSYEDFLCCLKNVWISVKNNMQKQKCLKFFLKCVRSTKQQPCTIGWTYYVNLAVHDLRVATLLVVTSAVFFVTSVILVEKCKESGYDSFVESSS
ncbi:uncharacterized protein LOC123681490 [Harmonia axyridis]|uniref:uncharacterized protein LOC123681490 n=1 Tax=Harmonia axyridis TaxID=115357 RepID=UPI001E276FF4|nr:uncharacterized protein LOC123681490 [Harmonia axyridis]